MANANLNNTIELVKNYLDDPNNLYGVLKEGLLTQDLETPFTEFVGASTMSYPLFPASSTDLPDYNTKTGYATLDQTLERKEVTITQDKGYQIPLDAEDIADSHVQAVAFINNAVRQYEVPSIDKYRLGKLATATGVTKVAVTTDMLADYDTAKQKIFDEEISTSGTVLYVDSARYNSLKQSDKIKRSVLVDTNNGNVNREVEMLDGETKIVKVPAGRMPSGVGFILVQPLAVIAGIKRNKTAIIPEPENFDGVLINRRLKHDCFVLEGRAKGIVVGTTA